MTAITPLEALLRRDRVVVTVALSAVVAMALAYTVAGIGMSMSALSMTRMALAMPAMMMEPAVWTLGYGVLVFFMWWVMMVAMMVPSAAPAVLIHARVIRQHETQAPPFAATALFLAGYLAAWAAFSLVATVLQWGLEQVGAVTGMMEIASPLVAGLVLIAAGLYQLTPLKEACLRHCRHPVFFLLHHWKPGAAGAFRMGCAHGAYCLGCCWVLMALLFVGGIMNLLWIAGLAIFVGIEKLAAGHRRVTMAAAAALPLAGLWLIARSYLVV